MTKGKTHKVLRVLKKYNKKVIYLIIFAVLAISLAHLASNSSRMCKNCNVVIINVDTVGAAALPCYGYPEDVTPNMCSIADEGVLFENYFASGAWTVPSMVSTLTSLFPSAHQFWGVSTSFIAPQQQTIQKVFSENGYSTTLITNNKDFINSFMYNMSDKFDDFLTIKTDAWKDFTKLELSQDRPSFIFFYTDPVHAPYVFPENASFLDNLEVPKEYATTRQEFIYYFGRYLYNNRHDIFTQKAISENPNILGGSFNEQKANEIFDFFDNNSNNFELVSATTNVVADYYLNEVQKYGDGYTKFMRAVYDARLKKFDEELKDLLDYLSSDKVSKNTIVIITSEHGEAFGEHNLFFHTDNLYNEILKVPLIIRSPKVRQKTITSVIRDIDLMPSMLDLVGIKKPEKIQGISFVGIMKNEAESAKRYAYAQVGRKEYKTSIQDRDWKLIVSKDKSMNLNYELFNLQADPGEKVNVYDKNTDVVKFLSEKIDEIKKDSEQYIINNNIPFPYNIDEEKLDELMKRGYF